jgi:putative DNA primase/helicase
LIPFTQVFPVNADLDLELRAEAGGILTWCVRGCLAWQQHGLHAPDVVTVATREYETDSDVLAGFLDEACERDPVAEIRASELFEHYKVWTEQHGLTERERLSSTMFGRKVSERFHKLRDSGNRTIYRGLARK